MRLWFCHCKHNQGLINVGYCRTDQLIFSGKQPDNIPFFFFFIQNLYLRVITYKRFYSVPAEDSFCFTFINTGSYYMNIVESGNSFYNFSMHGSNIFFLCPCYSAVSILYFHLYPYRCPMYPTHLNSPIRR